MCSINSGQKRFDGVPAKSAADSVSQGGFPLKHQNLKGAKPPSKNGIKPFWGGAEGRSGFGHPARRVFCGVSIDPNLPFSVYRSPVRGRSH